MSRNASIILACLIGFVFLLGVMFFLTYERVEVEVREPPQGEARENPFLAFERLTRAYGHTTLPQRIMDEPWDCPADHYSRNCTIVLVPEDVEVDSNAVHDFDAFVRAGGRLVINVGAEAKRSLLISEFEAIADPTEPAAERKLSTEFNVYSGNKELAKWMKAGDTVIRNQSDHVIAIIRPVGSGHIVFAARLRDVISNNDIGNAEHATLALQLIGNAEYQHITVVRYAVRASWMQYVFSKTWAAIVPLLIMLLFGIIAGQTRFGPMLPQPALARRQRSEHVIAVGKLLWKHDEVATLARAVRDALYETLLRRRAIPDSQPDAALLADALEIDRDTARGVLYDPSPRRPNEFLSWIRQMEQYRRQ